VLCCVICIDDGWFISRGLLDAPLYPLKPGVSRGPPRLSGGPGPLRPPVIRPLAKTTSCILLVAEAGGGFNRTDRTPLAIRAWLSRFIDTLEQIVQSMLYYSATSKPETIRLLQLRTGIEGRSQIILWQHKFLRNGNKFHFLRNNFMYTADFGRREC